MELMRDVRESGNGRTGGALSLDPIRLKPVPAVLSLSLRRRLACVGKRLGRQIGLEGVARREMAERCHDIVAAVSSDGA